MKRFCLLILLISIFFSSAWADGTRQLWPNTAAANVTPSPTAGEGMSKNQCFLALGSREGGNGESRPFARYQNSSSKASCSAENRLYFRLKDGEKVCLGFGGYMPNGGSATSNPTNGGYGKVKYRISKDEAVVYSEQNLPSSGNGFISTYAQAYYGPKILDGNSTRGYSPIVLTAAELGGAGDYYLEFDIGCDFGVKAGQPFDISLFDITVVDGNNEAKSGRVWSKAWGLTTNGDDKQVWATFYTMSTDGYLSKVYMSGAQPYRFVFGCNSFGATREYENEPNGVEKDRQSYPNNNTFQPEYPVFLTRPEDDFFGHVAQVPNIPKDLTFAGEAMCCEDLLFVVQLMYNEDATIELLMDTDGDDETDMIIADKLMAEKSKSRGYHYPWKDNDAIKEAGIYWYAPITASSESECLKKYKLSLFDQRFTYNSVVFNMGDTVDFTLPNMSGTNLTGTKVALTTAETTIFNEPLGSANNPVLIRNKADLVALANAVNSGGTFTYTIPDFLVDKATKEEIPATFTLDASDGFDGVNFYLIAPTGTIELGSDWVGIGNWEETLPFKGVFRAGRYSPNPLTDNTDDDFVKKFGDQDTIILSGATIGVFAYCDGATIDNIHIKGSINTSITYSLVDDDFIYNAGICAYAENTTIKHCSNACTISNTLIDDFYECYMGGIVAYAGNCTIDSCSNYASIYSELSYTNAGGIVGQLNGEQSLVKFCYNIGDIETEFGAAGICAFVFDKTKITNCKNEGNIIGKYSGGIVGWTAGAEDLLIESCENTSSIYGYDATGGIAGNVAGGTTIMYCLDTYDEGMTQNSTGPNIENSISVRPDKTTLDYYDSESGIYGETYDLGSADGWNIAPGITLSDVQYFYDEDGAYHLYETMCCGKTWRTETAGRLYKDSTSFYIKWDGRDSEGNCVIGDLKVRYQKNSGVTHFPFFDPENMNETETRTGGLKGLVVYRISPIQDSITKFDNDDYWTSSETDGINGASEYQRENYDHSTDDAKSVYLYQKLPEGYYQTENLSNDEYGIEMNLYWDDRRISSSGECEKTESHGLVIGKTNCTKSESKRNKKLCKVNPSITCYATNSNGDCTSFKGFCSSANYVYETVCTGTSECSGIENVSAGGYLGSQGGGHIFPKDNFGNKHTINTWWNGVEVQSLNTLKMYEHQVSLIQGIPIPMPIEISYWQVQNEKKYVLLEWLTASEENNDYFTIERSFNGVSWVAIGKVNGAGTTTVENFYSFEDKKPVEGISYYRLKQTDYNGEYSYSSVKCINRPKKANDSFVVYTNHEANAFIVEGEVIAACPIEVYSTTGARVYNVSFNTISVNKVLINVKDLPAGSYFVKICNGSKAVIKNW